MAPARFERFQHDRGVWGTTMGLLSRLRQTQIITSTAEYDRHMEIFDCYLRWLDEHPAPDPNDRSVLIIARSPSSPVARAFVDSAGALKTHGVAVKAIVSQTEPAGLLRETTQALAALADAGEAAERARWAAKACLHDAHEQLTLGPSMCWSGDMMRRQPGKRDSLDLFEAAAPQTVRLGVLAFDAIWEVCDPLPAALTRGVLATRPNATANHPDHRALAAHSLIGRLDRSTVTRH